ncbi:MAG TPA: hypothetical protein VI298_10660 [Geobacteraceae bacterium]
MVTIIPCDFTVCTANLTVFTYGVVMAPDSVCPFYGKNDDYCDVGCGYISPYDVNLIIRYCSRCYRNCHKYQELADRFPGEALNMVNC